MPATTTAKTLRPCALALIGWFTLAAPGLAQDAAPTTVAAKREAALDLSYRGRHGEALPMLEELSKALTNDVLIWERYAVSLLSTSATLADATATRQMRIRAKQAFNRSRELGNISALATLGDSIPSDGSLPPLAASAEAERFMKAGEAAFARRDFTEAIAQYQKALAIEPTNYEATLFVGDAYFVMKDAVHAGEWFARAIAISPDTETAHRYWGDALLGAGKPDEARRHFIDALIAEPYSQSARTGLSQWGQATGARFGRPAITPPTNVQKTETGTKITIDPGMLKSPQNSGMAAAWLIYSGTRAQWQNEEFKKRYPNEGAYRHSLAEEVDAFNRLLAFADAQEAKGEPLTDPQVSTIRGLRDKGMLEAYVLLHAPDAGIAEDYEAYRAEHRDRLQKYVESMIITPQRQ